MELVDRLAELTDNVDSTTGSDIVDGDVRVGYVQIVDVHNHVLRVFAHGDVDANGAGEVEMFQVDLQLDRVYGGDDVARQPDVRPRQGGVYRRPRRGRLATAQHRRRYDGAGAGLLTVALHCQPNDETDQ